LVFFRQFLAGVTPWRDNAPRIRITKIGCVLTKLRSILSRRLKSIRKIAINQTKKDNVPPQKTATLTNEKLFDLPGIEWSMLRQQSGVVDKFLPLDSQNTNQPNDKETMCLPRRQQSLTNEKLFVLPGPFDWFYRRLNKGDDERRICRSPPLNNEF